jgi:anti-sigma-K factor RskA
VSAHEHEGRRDDLAAYALGALEDSEAQAIEEHLAACRECARYLAGLRPGVDALATSVPQLEPPPALRDRLVATVRGEARRIEAASVESAPSRRGQVRWRALIARPAVAVGAAAILVAAAAIGYAVHGGGSASRSVVSMRPMPGARGVSVTASLMQVDGTGMLRVHHAPALRAGRVYEVWAQRGGRMRPESTFVPRRDGSAMAAVPNLSEASAVFVTVEPRGGSAHPTSSPLIGVDLG